MGYFVATGKLGNRKWVSDSTYYGNKKSVESRVKGQHKNVKNLRIKKV